MRAAFCRSRVDGLPGAIPAKYDSRTAYWTDIFTLETWAQAGSRDFSVTGFPAPTSGAGGYSVGMFERVHADDVLLCYCKSPAARWVGALRVTGRHFQSSEPIWGLTAEGEPRFPWRFPAEPMVVLEPARGIPGDQVAAQLAILRRLKAWYVYLQRSLNHVPDADGARLIELLRQPREPIPIPAGARRASRARPAARRGDLPEWSLLESQALRVEPGSGVDREDEKPEPRTHTEIQAKLRDIGFQEGFDVWVADRGLEWNDRRLGDGCLSELPIVAAEPTRKVMRGIDVIWFRKGTGHPVRFFEIEHSTSVYSGLLRFNDVMIDFPIPEAFVVGDGARTQAKFEREIARRTFEHSRLRDVTAFLSYEQVRQTWRRYQDIGRGSKDWGRQERRGPALSA